MYYTHSCSYCGKLFFTWNKSKQIASASLYKGIKEHLVEYGEDHKEYMFDEDPKIEAAQMYDSMSETTDKPIGAYEI